MTQLSTSDNRGAQEVGERTVYVKVEVWDMRPAYARIRQMVAMATTDLWDLRTQTHGAIDKALNLGPVGFGPNSTHDYLRNRE